MQMIRYHPLIDGDTDGLEKVPMFLSTDKETVRQNSRMYLSEIISNYYRLYSKEPMSQNATDSIEIHCPLCGAVLRQMAPMMQINLVCTPVTGADDRKKEDFTMVFPLTKLNKEGTLLNASHSYYSEEYAQRMCCLYLTDELSRDETGKIKRTYRLHASSDHTEEMAFAYEIHCPKCGNHLKQIGRQLTLNTLGLYKCPVCDRN